MWGNTTGMKICRPDNTRGGFLDCGWHFSTASNGIRGGCPRARSRSNLSARVIALAGIPLLDRKKFSGRRVSQLITQRSWNSGCCEIRVIGSRNWLVRCLVTSLYSLIKRASCISHGRVIIVLNGIEWKLQPFFLPLHRAAIRRVMKYCWICVYVANVLHWLIQFR